VTKAWSISSPWRDLELERRSPQEVAQEIDMNHVGSGATFFESMPIEQHRALFARSPVSTMSVDFDKTVALDSIAGILTRSQRTNLKVTPKGPLQLWTRLIDGRPDQTKNYIIGVDVSKGQGASNSVLSIVCCETREKVAEWADATVPPYELARITAAVALWFGGSRRAGKPLVIWEANGPGWDFGRVFVKQIQYPNYFQDIRPGTSLEKSNKKYGWHSTREKKEQMLGILRRAYAHGGIINHSEKALDEALQYVYFDDGGIGPAELTQETESARLTHGDRVIADGLAMLGLEGAPKVKEAVPATPERSMAHRQKMALVRKTEKPGWNSHWDFRAGEFDFVGRRR
jgi:hypothetical protein